MAIPSLDKYANIQHNPRVSEFENCYKCLRLLRNNIVHANKAYEPDTPQRLTDLLDWAESLFGRSLRH